MFKIVLKHPIFSYFTFSLSLLLLLIFTSIPSFNSLNNIVLDTLQTASNLQPRPEIVVIGIDDNSL